ncbi:hypothetical protein, partial [Escherichia coli]|uniref:hypothetical protein n=1 Tax=Escherichia coli TaxID=562 RepID=UPI001BDD9F96
AQAMVDSRTLVMMRPPMCCRCAQLGGAHRMVPAGLAASTRPWRPDICLYINGYRRLAFKLEAQRLPFGVFPADLDDLSMV